MKIFHRNVVIPRKRRDRYTRRALNYKTASGVYPVKSAGREALKAYSEYYPAPKGMHLHHPLIPFESIIEVFMLDYPLGIPVAYTNMRYEFQQWVAMEFARFHDDILKSHEGAALWLLTPEDHRAIHSEMRKENKEREIIKHWVEVLKEEKGG